MNHHQELRLEHSSTVIQDWRDQAKLLWRQAMPQVMSQGWQIAPVDPAIILPAFDRLFLRPGYHLQAYKYRYGRDGHALVYALPDGVALEAVVENASQPPAPPPAALQNPMQAIDGDGSLESYLQASIFSRELGDFYALGHGRSWDFVFVIGEDAWSEPGPVSPSRRKPASSQHAFFWPAGTPIDLNPRIEKNAGQVIVQFYTYTALNVECIILNQDTYTAGQYVFQPNPRQVAEGPQGFRI